MWVVLVGDGVVGRMGSKEGEGGVMGGCDGGLSYFPGLEGVS